MPSDLLRSGWLSSYMDDNKWVKARSLENVLDADCPLLQGDFDKLEKPTLPQFVATTVPGTFGSV